MTDAIRPVAARVAATVLLCAASSAFAGANLVTNGGFETGDFTGWTPTGDPTNSGVFDASVLQPQSGAYAASFSPPTPGGIMQTIATVAGQAYQVDFWLMSEADVLTGGASLPNSFMMQWGNSFTRTVNNSDPTPYLHFSEQVTAFAASTDLTFSFQQSGNGFWNLDSVSVTAVPEPAEWGLMLAGLAGLAALVARRRQAA